MTLALTAGSAPQPGDPMVGGGEQFTLSAVSVSGYAVMVSQAVPAGTGVTFAGGPGGAWLGTASPGGTDQMTLTVTAGRRRRPATRSPAAASRSSARSLRCRGTGRTRSPPRSRSRPAPA
jgi:hypothetical protein